jgi:hypothetical protein
MGLVKNAAQSYKIEGGQLVKVVPFHYTLDILII